LNHPKGSHLKTEPIIIDRILADVRSELDRAMSLHGPQRSAHESYAVLLEEVDEFWDEVKKKRENRDEIAMRKELIQIAAMACRAINDLRLPGWEKV
jgi:NTP pyrophosphatase (non-canonical NTP hydrolase)